MGRAADDPDLELKLVAAPDQVSLWPRQPTSVLRYSAEVLRGRPDAVRSTTGYLGPTLERHPDQPEWLSHVNASVLKMKLGTAIIGISSIHLLRTFINAASYDVKMLIAHAIHITFLLSAMALAACDRIVSPTALRVGRCSMSSTCSLSVCEGRPPAVVRA